jgi:prephenate dehydratase
VQHGLLSDVAAREIFSRLHIDSIFLSGPCETAGFCYAVGAMDAEVQCEIDYFVAPAKWLLSTSARYALAEFTRRPLCIAGVFASKPTLCLGTMPGIELRDCDSVMSDLTVLQMHEALIVRIETDRGLPLVRHVDWDSADACCTEQEEHTHSVAVLASKPAVHQAGLRIIKDDVDGPHSRSQTRYLVLGRRGDLAGPARRQAHRPASVVAQDHATHFTA